MVNIATISINNKRCYIFNMPAGTIFEHIQQETSSRATLKLNANTERIRNDG